MGLSNKTIVGVAVLLFGAVLLAAGMHHVVTTGTCSSTGYSSNYGPVPYCPAGTGWWIAFLIVGIMLVILGSLVGSGYGFLLIFLAIGIGAISVVNERHPASGVKTFGLIFGGCFAASGAIPLLLIMLGKMRTRARRPGPPSSPSGLSGSFSTPNTDPILSAYAAAKATPSVSPAPLTPPRATMTVESTGGDPLAKIERLSKLHKDGALTDAEFQREKERLLAEL